LQRELSVSGVKAQISGRPKHIYSIYNKMRQKSLDFEELYDARPAGAGGQRHDCYTVLGVVHNLWSRS
jgi:GTP pyrophosphokinase